jgi:hypothetical protein
MVVLSAALRGGVLFRGARGGRGRRAVKAYAGERRALRGFAPAATGPNAYAVADFKPPEDLLEVPPPRPLRERRSDGAGHRNAGSPKTLLPLAEVDPSFEASTFCIAPRKSREIWISRCDRGKTNSVK